MKNIKYISLVSLPMVIGSFKTKADVPLQFANLENNFLNAITETQKYLLTGDGILLMGFLLWIAYILFCFPKHTQL